MGTPDKDRQAAYKTRMRESGKRTRTFWMSPEQESVVKAYLLEGVLPVTDAGELDALKEQVASLSQQVEAVKRLELQYQEECVRLRNLHQVAAHDMVRMSSELKAARKAVPKSFNLSAPAASVRAKVLLEKIDQMTTWRGNKENRDAHGTRQEAEHLATLVRQTKAARTAIVKAEQELADVVSDGEKEVLTYARMALSQILDAAEIAKDRGRVIAKKREDHEQACVAAAEKAVAVTFQPVSIEDQIILIMAPGKPERYTNAADLLNGEAFKRTGLGSWGKEIPVDKLASTIAGAVREAIGSLVYKIRYAIQAPAEAVAKAQAIQIEMESRRPAMLAEHAELIQRIKAELVARRLERAVTTQEAKS